MGYIPKRLRQFLRGVDVHSNRLHTQVWLRNRQNTALVLFVSNALKIPSIQTMISGLKLEMYSGQRSNVDKWTPMQRLGFVVGVGRGISMPEWQQAFGLSESTIQKIYTALEIPQRSIGL